MSPLRTSKFTTLRYLVPLLVWLWLTLIPLAVVGQGPTGATPEPTGTPPSNFVYLPLILSRGEPCSTTPSVPSLEAPLPDAVISTDQPLIFKWEPVESCGPGPIHYTLQIASDIDFSPGSIVYGVGYHAYGDDDESDPYYQTSHDLPYGVPGIYYWRVAAFAGEQMSGWSEPRRITVQASSTGQLLETPSFEADPVDPWQWLVPEMTHRIVVDPQSALDGSRYLAVSRQDGAKGNKSFYQEIGPPELDQTYRFAIWVRASTEAINAEKPRTGRVDLWAYDGPAPREHSTHNFQVKDTNWHCVETSLTVTQSGQAQLRAEVYLTALDGFETYFDNALLRAGGLPICPPPLPSDGETLVSQGQGFDTCAAPSIEQLAVWKQASPFDYVGIYLGGINHYAPCKLHNQQNQTAAWFAAAVQQGWQFIPIWVGPQAPCTSYSTRLSSDPNAAWSEGVAEAQQALTAAANLSLITAAKPGTIIYYDMEHYSPSDPSCHRAVNAFLAGWVSELQNRGQQAGIYGSKLVANDWYTLLHVPDSVWIPSYIRDGYDPTMTVDAVNQEWVTESYWDNHRLFQYSNSHTEVWGGVALNIDNDAARGLIALGGAGTELGNIRGMSLLSPDQGWLWRNQQLFWTETGGEQWSEVTPPGADRIQDIFFLDTAHGWVVASGADRPGLSLWQTTDSGQHWRAFPLGVEIRGALSAVYLDFIDPQMGWLAVKLATGLNFSQGLLFKTEDGGATWTALTLPIGAPARFSSATTGWTAGGPTNGELYVTRDGGQSWQAQTIVTQADEPVAYDLPIFEDEQEGAIAVTRYAGTQTQVDFYVTQDGGYTWQLADSVGLERSFALGARPPLQILDAQHWLVADPRTRPTFPQNIVDLDLVPPAGWAITRDETCPTPCQMVHKLRRTTDGGQTWITLNLPQ